MGADVRIYVVLHTIMIWRKNEEICCAQEIFFSTNNILCFSLLNMYHYIIFLAVTNDE